MASILFKVHWTNKDGTENSAYKVRYRDPDGKRRHKQFPFKRQAKKFQESLSEYLAVNARGTGIPISEVADNWINACERGRNGEPPLEPETISGYETHLRLHIVPRLGTIRCKDFTKEHLQDFRDWLLANASSRANAKKILTTTKTLMGYALETNQMFIDPTSKVTIKIGGRHKKEIQIHNKAEMRIILQTAKELSQSPNKRKQKTWKRYYPVLYLMAYTGVRASELRGLSRKNIDLDNREIRIVERADRKNNIGPPKSASSLRTIAIPDRIVSVIREYLQTHKYDLAFPSTVGTPMMHTNLRKRMWLAVQEAAEVTPRSFHSIRHFYASLLIDNGANLKFLKTLMGHHDEAFTLRTYGHLFEDADTKAKQKELIDSLVL